MLSIHCLTSSAYLSAVFLPRYFPLNALGIGKICVFSGYEFAASKKLAAKTKSWNRGSKGYKCNESPLSEHCKKGICVKNLVLFLSFISLQYISIRFPSYFEDNNSTLFLDMKK